MPIPTDAVETAVTVEAAAVPAAHKTGVLFIRVSVTGDLAAAATAPMVEPGQMDAS